MIAKSDPSKPSTNRYFAAVLVITADLESRAAIDVTDQREKALRTVWVVDQG
jgi:hypothetical protein